MKGQELPEMKTAIPGPRSQELVDVLADTECPAITARRQRRADLLGKQHDDPIVWEEAVGANVTDVDGNRYIDMTSGFGVALVGHRHPKIVAAARKQTERLIHAMGDAWPDQTRIQFLQRLSAFAPNGLDVSILGLSGSDAVDAAIKTAHLHTGRSGILCFEGGYHGLSLGTVALQGYKASFTEPFRSIIHPNVKHAPWGDSLTPVEALLQSNDIGLVLVEPIQGRGGMRPAPAGWLADLARITRKHGAVFALDEIQTGVGRTGVSFAATVEGITPDLLCVGKALGGGFPVSACMGTREVMESWEHSKGEAIHTQTFLGHPVGCAAGIAVLDLMSSGLLEQVEKAATELRTRLEQKGFPVRGRGLMMGVKTKNNPFQTSRELLARGFISLPAGRSGEVLSLTPPACLTTDQMDCFVSHLCELTPPGAS